MEKVDVAIYGKFNTLPNNFIAALEDNADFINNVIVSEDFPFLNSLKELEIPIKTISSSSKNEAEEKNKLISSANTDYVLLLRADFILDEDMIEELLEETEENQPDIVYPNAILKSGDKEKVINYPDLFGNEISVLHGLAIEDCLPESVLLFKKNLLETVGKFNEYYKEFDIYEYIYKYIKKLRLKLAHLSFAIWEPQNDFIDTSYRSYTIRKVVIENYDWKNDIFPFLSWEKNEKIAKATAFTLIGNRLSAYYDFFNASEFYRKALLEFHNQETLKRLIEAYINMGTFEEAQKLTSEEQGMKKEEVEQLTFYIDKLTNLINELEKAIEEGKVVETIAALQEVTTFYSGAPIHNILGVIKWIEKKTDEAFKFFFKAVTMAPINKDYLYNLTETAKQLNRESDVLELINRLIPS